MNKWHRENITVINSVQFSDDTLSSRLSMLAEIVKLRITILVSFTTALGYFLVMEKVSINVIFPIIGIFLLACSSAALNQYQERDTDKLMDRTKDRAIPSGRIKPLYVLYISIFLLLSGSLILILKTNAAAFLIGLLTFFWYNAVYTPLKKKMVLAIIPGSLVGALPPIAGWAAAGGGLTDINILYVALYFFVWQIPHFWLLLLIYGNDYEKGGFPVLTQKMEKKNIVLITFSLLVLTVLIAAAMPFVISINYIISSIILLLACSLMLLMAFNFVRSELNNKLVLKTFISINIFTLLIISILSIDKLIGLFI